MADYHERQLRRWFGYGSRWHRWRIRRRIERRGWTRLAQVVRDDERDDRSKR